MYKILKLYPAILEDPKYKTIQQKYLASYIYSWTVDGKCCFVSNEFLQTMLCMDSFGEVEELLITMKKSKLIRVQHNGTARILYLYDDPNCIEADPLSEFILDL